MCSRLQFTDLTYIGGTRPCESMTIIFASVIWSQLTSLTIKFGVNRAFDVLKTLVYRFGLNGRYRTLWTDDDNFQQCYLGLVYNPNHPIWCESGIPCAQDPTLPIWHICGPMTIIFSSVIKSQYTSLTIKFGVNRAFHVLKTPVYQFGLYGRYRTLWTDDNYFQQCY